MISVKGGTQTWSKAEQTSALKSDTNRTMAAQDFEKALGTNENIGEVLNKISDPNWIDPVKTRKVGNDELGKDAFLKLLLAQMKNQDPTSPMESHQMAAQLAQFSSLEKLQNIDESMKTMTNGNGQAGASQFDALNLIGKAIHGDSTQVMRQNSEETHDVNFKLLKPAEVVQVTIKDEQGTVVRELETRNLKEGQNVISWNGLNNEGSTMGKGEYRVEIKATDSAGRKLAAETKFEGIVSGVNFSAEGPVLMMGKQKIRLKDVKSITQPDQLAKVATSQITNEITKANDNVVNAEGNLQMLDNVSMSRGMINKMSQETDKK
jgi:flagellar basal-body rod modification protein FlgD